MSDGNFALVLREKGSTADIKPREKSRSVLIPHAGTPFLRLDSSSRCFCHNDMAD